MIRALLAVPVALAALLFGSAGPATASCMLDERPLDQQIDEAEIVFVGRAVETTADGREARFEVSEVWKGEQVPAVVTISGAPQGGLVSDAPVTSVDRTFEAGNTYLVFPRRDGERFVDDACTPTRPWTDELAAARPASASEPQAEDGALPLPLLVAGAAIVLAALAAGALALRRS